MTHSASGEGPTPARAHEALTDPITGLANQLHFDVVYDYLFAAGGRGLTFTLMYVSAHGDSEPSDQAKRVVGQVIEETTRSSDLVSHPGGGRYLLAMLGTNRPGAIVAADRIASALEGALGRTACFGLAAYSADYEDPAALIEAASRALLVSEAAGGGVELG